MTKCRVNPCLRHEHTLIEHTLFELNLRLHRITFNKHSGVTDRFIYLNWYHVVVCSDSPPPIFWFYPMCIFFINQYSPLNNLSMYSTRSPWKKAALSSVAFSQAQSYLATHVKIFSIRAGVSAKIFEIETETRL